MEQSGFRFCRNTLEQVMLLEQRIVQAFNGGLCTAVAAIDVNKAYDSVWHSGLISICHQLFLAFITRYIAPSAQPVCCGAGGWSPLSILHHPWRGATGFASIPPTLCDLHSSDSTPSWSSARASAHADDVAVWVSADNPSAAGQLLEPVFSDLVTWGNN